MKTFLFIAAAASAVFCLSCARTGSPIAPSPAAQPSPVTQKGWESSGGSGVACSDREGNVTRVVTLDYWDYEKKFTYDTLSTEETLAKVAALLEEQAPIFHSRYQLVQARLEAATQPAPALPVVEDRTPKRPLEANCHLVQLAVRYTRSTPGKFPEVRLEVDAKLFALLDPLNRALLTLHERLYVLGKETPTAHGNSDDIRWVTAILPSQQLAKTLADKPLSNRAQFVQNLLVRYFGDYYDFFVADAATQISNPPPGLTPYSRYRSFGTLLKKLRASKLACLKKLKYEEADAKQKYSIRQQCDYLTLGDLKLLESLSEEEAFLFVTRWSLARTGEIENAENLVRWDPQAPAKTDPRQQAELERACPAIDASRTSLIGGIETPFATARAYCTRLGLLPPAFQRFHCEKGEASFSLKLDSAGTYTLALRGPGVAPLEKNGLYCAGSDKPFLNLSCESPGFPVLAVDLVRVDPNSDKRRETREVTWGDLSTRWDFAGGTCAFE